MMPVSEFEAIAEADYCRLHLIDGVAAIGAEDLPHIAERNRTISQFTLNVGRDLIQDLLFRCGLLLSRGSYDIGGAVVSFAIHGTAKAVGVASAGMFVYNFVGTSATFTIRVVCLLCYRAGFLSCTSYSFL